MSVHYHYLPRPRLAAFVDGYCLTENDGPSPLSTGERYLPGGQMELNVLLGGGMLREYNRLHQHPREFQEFYTGELSGVNSQLAIGDTVNLVSLIKVLFKPYGAFPLLPFPAVEVLNQPLSLETLWGTAANDLCEQLHATRTPKRKFHILEEFLLARLNDERAPHPAILDAVKEFRATHGRRPVSQVMERLGLTPKRFIHLFREAVGLTPKLFCRIQRFQQIRYLIEHEEHTIGWADMATAGGYFDQAHLIHDFQTFSGSTPEAYYKQKCRQRNATRSEAAYRSTRNDEPLDHLYGLNACGYPGDCRRSLNTELLQHPAPYRRLPFPC